ncbi:transposase family protein [Pediococcus acidilactici]|uniref:transposase family protein n=2 Tax=Pediococcus acidilactici TaxID=1254 RepID=UPI0019504AB8|nr:transposase family protein [Pediococcus acidilactici]MBM6604510.1 transposase [Pediococcus acidilactici]MBM6644357.1 transposase [Pediococcus acidilactici]MCB5723623.1 transposase family protein [Pediococcus acidilactici]MCB5730262.1 transposase family protein [Pediococcus acidilactici]MCB5732013.1 transposase family protein [Pediococcus acidilactici]
MYLFSYEKHCKKWVKTVYVRDISFNDKPVILQIDKLRFLCKACHYSTIAQNNLIKKHTQLAKSLEFSIISYLSKDLSIDNNVQKLNVFPDLVNRIVTDLHDQWIHPKATLPEQHSIDEVRTTQHQMSFLTINAENGVLVTLLPDYLSKILSIILNDVTN